MSEYYDLPYTGAEVAADLAKVHDHIVIDGDGSKVLTDNGTYVDLGLGDMKSVLDEINGEEI